MEHKISVSHSLGIECHGNKIDVALVSKRGDDAQIHLIKTCDWREGTADVKQLYTDWSPELKILATEAAIVSAVDGTDTLVRPLELSLSKDKDIAAVLNFEAEPLIPYPLEEAVIDWIRQSGAADDGTSRISVLAIRKNCLKTHLEGLSSQHIVPEIVSTVPAAVATFSGLCHPGTDPILVIHIGREQSSCVLAARGTVLAASSVPLGVQHLQEALHADATDAHIADIDFDELSPDKYSTLGARVDTLTRELSRSCYGLKKHLKKYSPGSGSCRLACTGEGASLQSLPARLSAALKQDLEVPEPVSGLASDALSRYAVPIGLGCSAVLDEPAPINFRQQDFAYPHPLRRLMKPVATYLGICLALTVALYAGTAVWASRHSASLQHQYAQVLAEADLPADAFEIEYRRHHGPSGDNEESLAFLSHEEIFQRLAFLDKKLSATPQSFALTPLIPRVSDLLAWLSTHPQVVSTDSNTGQTLALVTLDSFTYSMIKRPDSSHSKERYRLKIDLELHAVSPREARAFHEALRTPNGFLDPKSEVQWSSHDGQYKVSFYLADKTRYGVTPSSSHPVEGAT